MGIFLYFSVLILLTSISLDLSCHHVPVSFNAGMPEMLKPTSLIMGAGLGHDVACLTDGRFSGG